MVGQFNTPSGLCRPGATARTTPSTTAQMYKRPETTLPLVPHLIQMDEFSSYCIQAAAPIFEMARGARQGLMPAFQTAAGLRQKVARSQGQSRTLSRRYDYRVRPEEFASLAIGEAIVCAAGQCFKVRFPLAKPLLREGFQVTRYMTPYGAASTCSTGSMRSSH